MKRAVILMLILSLCLSLCACIDLEEEPPAIEFDPDIPHITIEEYYNNIEEYFNTEVYIEGYVSTRYFNDSSISDYYEIIITSDRQSMETIKIIGGDLHYTPGRTMFHYHAHQRIKDQWKRAKNKAAESKCGIYMFVDQEQYERLEIGDYIIIQGIVGYNGQNEENNLKNIPYFELEDILDIVKSRSSRYPK